MGEPLLILLFSVDLVCLFVFFFGGGGGGGTGFFFVGRVGGGEYTNIHVFV